VKRKSGDFANNFLDISPRIRYSNVFKDGGEKASIVVSRLVFSREKAGRFERMSPATGGKPVAQAASLWRLILY